MAGFPSSRSGPAEPRSDGEATPHGAQPARTGPTAAYDLLHLGQTDVVACVEPCLIVVSFAITPEGVEAIGRGIAKLTQRQQKACSLSIVERKSGPATSPEAREALAEIARKYGKSVTGGAVVCDGTGFSATATRSVVTGINMASRSPHPTQVFATLSPALVWLQSLRPSRDLDLALLARAATMLREHLQNLARASGRPGG